jgi:hypothetical protein
MANAPKRTETIATSLTPLEYKGFLKLCRTLAMRPAEILRLGIQTLAEKVEAAK